MEYVHEELGSAFDEGCFLFFRYIAFSGDFNIDVGHDFLLSCTKVYVTLCKIISSGTLLFHTGIPVPENRKVFLFYFYKGAEGVVRCDMKGRLLEDEITASQVIQYTPGGWYIVSGENEEALLQNEEELRKDFEALTGGQVGYVSTSNFVPSQATQEKSRAAYEKLLSLAETQLQALGFDDAEAQYFAGKMQADFAASSSSGSSPGIAT